MKKLLFHVFGKIILLFFITTSCSEKTNTKEAKLEKEKSSWLNHNDSVKYVGKETCKTCHQEIYNSFIETGMGHSFDTPEKFNKLSQVPMNIIYDKFKDFYYLPYYKNRNLWVKEFRLEKKDTVYQRTEKADFVIGNGLQTISFLQNVNGYLNEMPLTYYTQIEKWDLSPGYENGNNTRFSRKIGIECMACHNAYPKFVNGSENKYDEIEKGIDCERCHGPGEIHVNQRMTSTPVNTSKVIDYSIVNPAKLSINLQLDVCQRCHLHGNTVLKDNKSFFDFKPGQSLNEMLNVFHAKTKNETEIKFVSHAERLKMSKCFLVSNKKSESSKDLRPYKNGMTCVTCHNPHISVQKTSSEAFNKICNNCHGPKIQLFCSENEAKRIKVLNNCVSCHMPKIESNDIIHGSVHDHYISKKTKISKDEVEKIKSFVSLICLNEDNPTELQKAKGFLNEYDKVKQNLFYLDSAEVILMKNYPLCLNDNFESLIQLYFSKNNFEKIIEMSKILGNKFLLEKKLINISQSSNNAWTCYRIGEAYYNTNNTQLAELFFEKAVYLAPFNPEFKNKLALSYFQNKKVAEARKLFTNALIAHPKYVPALTNLGYLNTLENDYKAAEENFSQALKYDPDYQPLLLNLAGLRAAQSRYEESSDIFFSILNKNPNNKQVEEILISNVKYHLSLGNRTLAKKIIKKYLLIFPKNNEAKILLKKLTD